MSTLVTQKAPDFTAAAVLPNGEIVENYNLLDEIRGSYAILFFYPLDFTFVCPSELIAFHKRAAEFEKRNVKVIGISIDSQFTHNAWRNTPIEQGGVGQLSYPLIADISHNICRAYGVEHPDGVALRGTFVIDREGIVRSEIINDLPLGRNVDEFLRLVDALQYTEEHGEVCPAGWQTGSNAITPTAQGISSYLKDNSETL